MRVAGRACTVLSVSLARSPSLARIPAQRRQQEVDRGEADAPPALGVQLERLALDLLSILDLLQLALLLFLMSLHLEFFALNSGLALGFVALLGALAEFVLQMISLGDLLGNLVVDLLFVFAEALQSFLNLIEVLLELALLMLQLDEVTLLILGAAGPLLVSETAVAGILNGFFRPVGILQIFHIKILVDDLVLELLVFFILIVG